MPSAVALFASGIAPGAQFLTLGTPLLFLSDAEFSRSLSSFFSRLDRSITHLAAPRAVPSAAGGKQRYSQQAKDQQFHGVIDEGNPGLFRKSFEL
jgi:hypothetical protein